MLKIEAEVMGEREIKERSVPVMASTLVKPRHASDLPARKERGIQSQFYDPRPPKFQNLDADGILK